ncbi:MAG: very short patch repair endonuclease [Chloroflexota bacterium]|nr:very short patch repair endonuclease [Chloroflexota bacterium]
MSLAPEVSSPSKRHDPLTPEARSSTMRKVRRVDTSPELALRRELTRRGLRYRVDYPRAAGRPDIAMVGKRLAIFVDGEFWHGKKLSQARLAEMSGYWQRKIQRNVERDVRVNGDLMDAGWTVIRVTDRAVNRDLLRVANFLERAAGGQYRGFRPPGIELHRP